MTIDIIPTGSSAVISDNCTRDVTLMSAIKDAEADLERSAGTRYGNTLGAIKNAECNIDRLAADRFSETAEDIKEVEVTVEKAHGFTRDVVRQSEIATEAAKAKVIDTVQKTALYAERGENQTRSLMANGYADLKNSIFNTEKELGYSMLQGFKEQQMTAYQLANAADKTACANAAAAALAFKEIELRQERLAALASKEAMVNSCELKELVRFDGQKTRDLITQNEIEKLRNRVMKAETALCYFSRCGFPYPGGPFPVGPLPVAGP